MGNLNNVGFTDINFNTFRVVKGSEPGLVSRGSGFESRYIGHLFFRTIDVYTISGIYARSLVDLYQTDVMPSTLFGKIG